MAIPKRSVMEQPAVIIQYKFGDMYQGRTLSEEVDSLAVGATVTSVYEGEGKQCHVISSLLVTK